MKKKYTVKRLTRTAWDQNQKSWFFAIVDVVRVLTMATDPGEYTRRLRKSDPELQRDWSQMVSSLNVKTKEGSRYINCTDVVGLIRIVSSLRSPRVRSFQKWLQTIKTLPLSSPAGDFFTGEEWTGLYKILSDPARWKMKCLQYTQTNHSQPSYKRMNAFEIVFALLEEGDIYYRADQVKKRRIVKKISEEEKARKKMLLEERARNKILREEKKRIAEERKIIAEKIRHEKLIRAERIREVKERRKEEKKRVQKLHEKREKIRLKERELKEAGKRKNG